MRHSTGIFDKEKGTSARLVGNEVIGDPFQSVLPWGEHLDAGTAFSLPSDHQQERLRRYMSWFMMLSRSCNRGIPEREAKSKALCYEVRLSHSLF